MLAGCLLHGPALEGQSAGFSPCSRKSICI